ncbi:MAG TPA: hypothetical protein PLA43_12140 [Bryobacteraceae bacterium]|nr:hypothetical protein [Bryobacteraceae bacterium]HOQ46159.1 hypothetical protein [Bryobacteraceae bacterium]HPQ17029.1 hypothetical protein [Bryobacteraceae bacterium]HPU72700.1 hypothetical protein [Bryobacteraceae bacterium]
MLTRFNRLMRDIENGASSRQCFQPWEVELLLDIEACGLDPAKKRRVLSQYANAARRRFEQGIPRPLKLSEYLAGRRRAKASVKGVA